MIYFYTFKRAKILAVLVLFRLGVYFPVFAETATPVGGNYSQQTIKDFYLTNYNEEGGQDWELKGNEAIIYEEYVDIDKMNAKYYTPDDIVKIKSKKAQLNKKNMDIYLRHEVEIENKQGIKLLTDSLNWQRGKNKIETDDWVTVDSEAMQIKAKGMVADTQMETVDFETNVQVKLPDKKTKEFTVITCQGPLVIQNAQGTATFSDNVVVENKEGTLFSDVATAFFDTQEKKIIKIVSQGNVKIVKGENTTFAQKATYIDGKQDLILEGEPHVVYFPDQKEKIQ